MHLVKGEESDVYLGEYDDPGDSFRPIKHAAVKIAGDRGVNSLLENEVIVLRQLNHQSLPELIDHFVIPGEGKKALVLGYIEGYDFHMLKERFPSGIPDKHLCWILERLLSVLGFMHYNAIIHGNIEPGNIMVRPRDHNAFLLDFNYSLIAPEKGERLKPLSKEFTAPEVFARMPPHPASDLYSLGKSMLFLAGGDVELDTFPPLMDRSLATFILGLLERNPSRRSNDAWKLHGQLSELRQRVFGARHEFLPFDV